jgi:hypothetical protein
MGGGQSCLASACYWLTERGSVQLLIEWPTRFISLMKKYRIASTPLLRDFYDAPFWYSSVVIDHLYVNNVNRRFAGFWMQ